MKKQFLLGIAATVLAMGTSAWATPAYSTNFVYNPTPVYSGNVNFPTVPSETAVFAGANGDTITLASTATGRYNNPEPVVTGIGQFTAQAGFGVALPANVPAGSTWNYNFYVNVTSVTGGAGNVGNYTFQILYQTAPGAAFSILPIPSGLGEPVVNGTIQDGENLTIAGAAFNPNTDGTYNFVLEALQNNVVLGASAISVTVVPETSSTALLFALTLGGLAAGSYVRRQSIA